MVRVLVAWIATMLVALPVGATSVYQWTDSDGVTHFSTDPPPDGVEADSMVLDSGPQSVPSERVQEIRCRDFRGAVDQLDALDDVPEDNEQWLAARELASERVDQWCKD